MQWTSVEPGHMMKEKQRTESLGQQSTPGWSRITYHRLSKTNSKTDLLIKFLTEKKYVFSVTLKGHNPWHAGVPEFPPRVVGDANRPRRCG